MESSTQFVDLGTAFIAVARQKLRHTFYPKIQTCVDVLTDEDVWWRTHETDNSVGNLLLHLSGNMRQWIIVGIGGGEDERNRAMEFAERARLPKEELLRMFEATVREADDVLRHLDPGNLLDHRRIQKYDVTCLDAILHVVEHVAQHMGQIIYITKLRKGIDLKFYNL